MTDDYITYTDNWSGRTATACLCLNDTAMEINYIDGGYTVIPIANFKDQFTENKNSPEVRSETDV